MQRCTTRRTFCSLRSSAKRWGSVRIGCKASFSRDSLMTSLSLYPGRDSRWSRNSVELLILRNNQRTFFPPGMFLNLSIKQKDTHMQHWDSGDRMEISSLECFPNLGGKVWLKWATTKQNFTALKKKKKREMLCLIVFGFTLWHCPSAEGILPHQIWKKLHSDVCPCYLWEQKCSQRIPAVKLEVFV